MKTLATMLVIILACSSSSDNKKSKDGAADQFAGVSRAALLDTWQGTWVMPFRVGDDTEQSSIGTREIWTIHGATLTRFNGVSTRSQEVRIIAPCLAKMSWMKSAVVGNSAPAGMTFSYQAFYFGDGALHVDESGGYQQGGVTFVCFANDAAVVIHRDDTCHLWTYPGLRVGPPKMERHPASCSYVTDAGSRYFDVRSTKLSGGQQRLLVSGDLLTRPLEVAARPAQKFPSHKAALDHLTNR